MPSSAPRQPGHRRNTRLRTPDEVASVGTPCRTGSRSARAQDQQRPQGETPTDGVAPASMRAALAGLRKHGTVEATAPAPATTRAPVGSSLRDCCVKLDCQHRPVRVVDVGLAAASTWARARLLWHADHGTAAAGPRRPCRAPSPNAVHLGHNPVHIGAAADPKALKIQPSGLF
jgi:hypothetical protein